MIEYSGYGYADPSGPQNGIAPIANLLGFAVVDINARGTGCSGGAYDFFDRVQDLDGYDAVETVARQPWVLHHRVGMIGISFGGISQLFVGATDPPHLAAIAPLSVLDSATTILYAGGILNTGFTLNWLRQRDHDAEPASATGGQGWALTRIEQGDTTCKANQTLHPEAVNLIRKTRRNSHYVPAVADPISPATFVDQVHVPVYLACQFNDEQTGGYCPDLAQRFTGTRHKWFTFTNGLHVDSLDPATVNRWYDFLELYVAQQAPHLSPAVRALAPTIYEQAMNIQGVGLPPDPIQSEPTYAAALAAFQALPSVRIRFDNGAGGSTPGAPVEGFEQSFPRLPIPGTRARSLFLAPGGALAARAPRRSGVSRFQWNPAARAPTDFPVGGSETGPGGIWTGAPAWNWTQNPPGTALSYVTPPLAHNTVVVGPGAVQLWVRSSAPTVDLQATVTEVRPDGNETYVQSGWLRANERKLDPARSTLLQPMPSFRLADVARLPRGRFSELTVPLYYEGHAYRAGSRIRILISAVGGDQPVVGLRRNAPAASGFGVGGVLAPPAVAPDPAGRAGGGCADRAAPVSGVAGRAVPALRGAGQSLSCGPTSITELRCGRAGVRRRATTPAAG